MAEVAGPRHLWVVFAAALCAGCTARSAPDPVVAYLSRLIAGDRPALEAGFVGEPAIDDPMDGQIRGRAELERFVSGRHQWLTERAATVESLRTTRDDRRTVFEAVLHLRLPDTAVDLPIAVVGDRGEGSANRVSAIRVYHSHWPLLGAHRVRAPLLSPDSTLVFRDVVGQYQRALASGNVDSIVDAFEPDGYFREPSGGVYVHRGHAALRAFMQPLLAAGGVGIEHCTLTDDGVAAAIEFTAVRFGNRQIAPQAGLAVYERGPSGKLLAARIYDDVNVEVLAPATVSDP